MVIRTLAMAVSSLVLAGCVSVGPNYKAPVQEPVVLQGAQQPVFSTTSPVASWWAQFDDPVLEELVHGALSDNLDLRVAVARVSQARAVFVEAVSTRPRTLPRAAATTAASNPIRSWVGSGCSVKLPARLRCRLGAGSVRPQAPCSRSRARRPGRRAGQPGRCAGTGRRRGGTQLLRAARYAEAHRGGPAHPGQPARYAEADRGALGAGRRQRAGRAEQSRPAEGDRGRYPAAGSGRNAVAQSPGGSAGPASGNADRHACAARRAGIAKALPLGDTRELLRQRADVRVAERRLAAATARVGVATADLFPRLSLSGSSASSAATPVAWSMATTRPGR